MKVTVTTPEQEGIELHPDAWERTALLVKSIAGAGAQPREPGLTAAHRRPTKTQSKIDPTPRRKREGGDAS